MGKKYGRPLIGDNAYSAGKERGKNYLNSDSNQERNEVIKKLADDLSLAENPGHAEEMMKGFIYATSDIRKRKPLKESKKEAEKRKYSERQSVGDVVSEYKPGKIFRAKEVSDATKIPKNRVGLILGRNKEEWCLEYMEKEYKWKKITPEEMIKEPQKPPEEKKRSFFEKYLGLHGKKKKE